MVGVDDGDDDDNTHKRQNHQQLRPTFSDTGTSLAHFCQIKTLFGAYDDNRSIAKQIKPYIQDACGNGEIHTNRHKFQSNH